MLTMTVDTKCKKQLSNRYFQGIGPSSSWLYVQEKNIPRRQQNLMRKSSSPCGALNRRALNPIKQLAYIPMSAGLSAELTAGAFDN